jgi:hypothetical protein
MRKVLIIALALVSFDAFTQTAFAARNCSIEAGECYAQLKQAGYALNIVAEVCQSRARLCRADNLRGGLNFSGEAAAIGTGGTGTAPGSNTHAVGVSTTAGAMSTNPGAATATMPAASGPVSTPVSPPKPSSVSKPAGGGAASGPGAAKFKTQ